AGEASGRKASCSSPGASSSISCAWGSLSGSRRVSTCGGGCPAIAAGGGSPSSLARSHSSDSPYDFNGQIACGQGLRARRAASPAGFVDSVLCLFQVSPSPLTETLYRLDPLPAFKGFSHVRWQVV